MRTSLFFAFALAYAAYVRAFGFPDCVNGPLANTIVCDMSATPSARAQALIAMFTTDELISNSNVGAPGVPRLGVPAYQAAEEGLHGLANSPGIVFADSGDFSFTTSFPSPLHMSAAFDDPGITAVAEISFTPNINPFRDPRWGRGQETPGEDPFRAAQYSFNFVTGLQGGIDPPRFKILADCKHLAGYDLEDPPGTNRFVFEAIISQQDLVEYYLPPFQSCVRDAKVGSVMCSFNALNGLPSCADPFLLQTILRDHWGFDDDRWVVADCDAIEFMFDQRHFVPDLPHAAAAGMNAGTDLDCGTTYGDNLGAAVNMSLVNVSMIAPHCLTLSCSLGYFDPPNSQPYRQLSWADVNTPSAQNLAYQIAADGMKLALIGPWATATTVMQSNYAGPAPFLISPFAAAEAVGFDVTLETGTAINSADTSGFAAAVAAAQAADAVVYAGGIDNSVEAEGTDRTTIVWPGNQLDLIAQLAAVGKPLVVLQFGGGQLDDAALKDNSNVSAILWGGYPGQSGGTAVVDIISGKVSPAGRLPVTQYPADYVNQVPMTDMSLRPSSTNPGRTYKWFTGTSTYEIWFRVELLHLRPGVFRAAGGPLDLAVFDTFQVAVSNTGTVASDYVVLGFVNTTAGPSPFPNKELVSYARVKGVGAGQSATASLKVTLGATARIGDDGNASLYPGDYTLMLDVPTGSRITSS
ncbi:putative exo-1,4-beta-xylosidase bxlB [Mycena venus]|uniref:xylan 1,4-beta-xylosidase n=1 Tax=Mycena venus TaxID=2733690 RepID=A0A8H6XEZ5_9AGAR|nr:putative exo-1,4-beta-xylosidase bxlB [Mycena venus]